MIDNYYILTKRFYFNWHSVSSLYSNGGPSVLTGHLHVLLITTLCVPVEFVYHIKLGDSSQTD